MRRLGYPILIATLAALLVPGSSLTAAAKEGTVIRIATLSPRNSPLVRDLLKLDKDLREATNDQVGIKVYPAGVAGDEKDVIRKMRVGQMDAAVITTTGLGQISRPVVVLDAPGVVSNYEQLRAVQKEMQPEWEQTLLDSGFKLLAWGVAGSYRYFSSAPITHPDDLKKMRPWLWPESFVMRELWQTVGATGVPLGVPEVYGALQTRMIDMVIGTALTFTMLQWHTKLSHMSKDSTGMLMMAMVMGKDKWGHLSETAQKTVIEVARRNSERNDAESLKNDKRAYEMLLKRGYTAVDMSPEGEKAWEQVQAEVRKRLTGRIYPAELLTRVQGITSKL